MVFVYLSNFKGNIMSEINITTEDANNLLAALMRMEHKTTGSMTAHEYWAVVRLAREVHAPQFITEYFARKAIDAQPE